MKTSRVIAKLRQQSWYPLVVIELARLGVEDYAFEPPTGKGHPKLVLRAGDRSIRIPVPSSGGGWTNYSYLLKEIRAAWEIVRQAK